MHYLFYCRNGLVASSLPAASRPYPEVDTTLFKTSATKAITLMNDANLVMKKITTSNSFSNELMTAAQQSNQAEVEKLIQSAGIKNEMKLYGMAAQIDFPILCSIRDKLLQMAPASYHNEKLRKVIEIDGEF